MREKKDRRSKRDKLKDGIIEKIQDEIELRRIDNKFHIQKANQNNEMVKILEKQIDEIHQLCEKEGDESKP